MGLPTSEMREFQEAGRSLGAATLAFHRKVAFRLGLNDTDHKCLDVLMSAGAMTAGELAREAGFTSGTITGVVNRLAAAGLVTRQGDPRDLRRVRVEPLRAEVMARMWPLLQPMVQRLEEVRASYDSGDQEVILSYIRQATDALKAATQDIE